MNLLRRAIISASSFNLAESFDTTLSLGTCAAKAIVSDLDFIDKDGVIIGKNRDSVTNWFVTDTLRGSDKVLLTDLNSAEATIADAVTQFNVDGFDVGVNSAVNSLNDNIVYYQLMKDAGFFDVIVW